MAGETQGSVETAGPDEREDRTGTTGADPEEGDPDPRKKFIVDNVCTLLGFSESKQEEFVRDTVSIMTGPSWDSVWLRVRCVVLASVRVRGCVASPWTGALVVAQRRELQLLRPVLAALTANLSLLLLLCAHWR